MSCCVRYFCSPSSSPPSLLAVPLATAKEPPILDRELFFGDPEIAGAQISPDGKYLAFIKPLDEIRNVWVKKTDEPFEAARPLTADMNRPIPGYFWSRDGRYILFVQDNDGDENYNIHAVNPADKPAEGQKVPASRNVTDLEGVRAMIYAVPKSDPGIIYVGLNDRDPAWHDLYRLDIASGETTLLRENNERIASWTFDLAGKLRLATRVAENGDTEVMRVDADGFTKIYSCTVFESCGPSRFHKDGKRVYMVTNRGDGIDLSRLVLFDPATGEEELVESDPENRVDFGGAIFSEVTDELVGTVYNDERRRMYWRDKSFEKDYKWLQKKLPGMQVSGGSSTADETLWLVAASSDVEPGERYLFDRKKRKADLPVPLPRGDTPRAPGQHAGDPLQVVGRPGDPRLPDAPQGRQGREAAGDRLPPRRPVGPRLLGLRRVGPVPGQPRLRRPATQLPRLHRLRQGVPQRRQQRVGPADAGRHHLGRQVLDR